MSNIPIILAYIKTGLISKNEALGTLVNAGHELSVVFTRPPPHGKLYHQVTVRVSPEIRRAIKAAGNKVHLSDRHCRVADNFHIKRCNKCQSFGHYASKCKPDSQDICGYCGEHHKSSECLIRNSPSHTHKCCNCELASLENFEGHSTFWRDCPAYKIQQDKLKGAIAYDYSFKLNCNSQLTTINCLLWNAQSLNNKIYEFVQLLDDNNVDVAFVSETWLSTESGATTFAISETGYKVEHSYRSKRGGGAAIIPSKFQTLMSLVETALYGLKFTVWVRHLSV